LNKPQYSAYFYLLPALSVIMIFQFIPIFVALGISFTDWDLIEPPSFVGLENYIYMFTDPSFWNSVKVTLYFSIASVILQIASSLVVAVLLSRGLKAIGLYRTSFFLPFITSLVAASIVWQWIYDGNSGFLNFIVQDIFKLEAQNWLDDPDFAMPAIILMSVWRVLGYNAIIFLTRLQTIDKSYYEAAEIDGAGEWKKFWSITWPLLTPTTLFLLIISTITSFQVFVQVYIMTPYGGPANSTDVLVFHLYRNAFINFDMGYACSIAYFILFVLLPMPLIQRKVLGERAQEMSQ